MHVKHNWVLIQTKKYTNTLQHQNLQKYQIYTLKYN